MPGTPYEFYSETILTEVFSAFEGDLEICQAISFCQILHGALPGNATAVENFDPSMIDSRVSTGGKAYVAYIHL